MDEMIVYLLIFNLFIRLQPAAVYIFIGASGLYSDVWAAWTELALNLAITLCLAPFYGIVGILLGKIISVFFIATFWKPYFLFSKGLHKRVTVYWKGMFPYYAIFLVFIAVTLFIRYMLIEPQATNLLNLIGYGLASYIPLLLLYFLSLFFLTNGMKYFIARKPRVYYYLLRKRHFNSF